MDDLSVQSKIKVITTYIYTKTTCSEAIKDVLEHEKKYKHGLYNHPKYSHVIYENKLPVNLYKEIYFFDFSYIEHQRPNKKIYLLYPINENNDESNN